MLSKESRPPTTIVLDFSPISLLRHARFSTDYELGRGTPYSIEFAAEIA